MESSTEERQEAVVVGSEAIVCTEGLNLPSEHQAYKKLLVDIASELLPEDIEKLAFMESLPAVQKQTGLDLLRNLDKKGKIGQFKIAELERMLIDAHRSDLVTSKINPFRQKYHSGIRKEERHRHKSDAHATYHRITHSPISSDKRANTFPAFGSTENIVDKLEPNPNDNLSSMIQQETEEPNANQRPVTSTPVTGRFTPASMSSHYSSQSTSDHVFNPYESSSSYSEVIGIGVTPHQLFSKQRSQTTSYSDLSIGGGSSAAEMSGYLLNAKLFSSSQQEGILGPGNTSPLPHKTGYYTNGDDSLPRSVSAVPQSFSYAALVPVMIQQPIGRRSFTPPGCVPLQREKTLQSPLASTEQFSLPAKNDDFTSRTDQGVTHASLSMNNSATSHISLLPEFSSEAPPQSEVLTTFASPAFHKPRKKKPAATASPAHLSLSDTCTQSTLRHTSQQLESSMFMSDESSRSSGSSAGDDSPLHEHISDLSVSAEHSSKYEGSGAYGQSELSSSTVNGPLQVRGGVVRSGKLKLHRRSKQKEVRLKWRVKRDKLNKAIYKHKENLMIECKKKLEIDIGMGSGLNPKLILFLHPYGLKEDREKNVTLAVHISAPKKAPPLKDSAKVVLLLIVSEKDGDKELLCETCREIDLNLRVYIWDGIITHEALRRSRSETIEIEMQVAKED